MQAFDFQQGTRVVFGEGAFARLGELAREHAFFRTLIVADRGIVATGQVDGAATLLDAAGVEPFFFHDFTHDPDSAMVEAGRAHAAACQVDSILAIGGGSSLDCARGINFVLTSGGTMRDYWGYGKATRAMLPSIGVPTTAGTGSEARSLALIADAATRAPMVCGDPKSMFRAALLDPLLSVSQPRAVTAVTGFDAIAHAVESYVTTRRSVISDLFAREAWGLLEGHYARVLAEPTDIAARGGMLLGAHLAGIAIEQSMLGATHACASALTAHCGIRHGVAIAVMLPHVVRWNAGHVGDRYSELLRLTGRDPGDAPGARLASRLEELARAAGLPATLGEIRVPRKDFLTLAAAAAGQRTGTFNPRPFDAPAALALYQRASGEGD